MSERYAKLFALPKYLYTDDAPVVIMAGALLKDNDTGAILAQLKFKNIDNRIIKALTVELKTYDSAGRLLKDIVTKQYLDLNAGRESEFGQKTAIPVENYAVRSFQVTVTEVVFANRSVWQWNDTEWTPLDALLPPLTVYLDDNELVKQYRIKFGADCKYYPAQDGEIWTCSCGAFNHTSEKACHNCNHSYKDLFSISLEKLELEKEQRIEAEKAAAIKKAVVIKRKKKKLIAAVLSFFTLILVAGTFVYIQMKQYAIENVIVKKIVIDDWHTREGASHIREYTIKSEQDTPFVALINKVSGSHADAIPVYMENGCGIMDIDTESWNRVINDYHVDFKDEDSFEVIGYLKGEKVDLNDIHISCTVGDSLDIDMNNTSNGLLIFDIEDNAGKIVERNCVATIINGESIYYSYYGFDDDVIVRPKIFCKSEILTENSYEISKEYSTTDSDWLWDDEYRYEGEMILSFNNYDDGYILYTENLFGGDSKTFQNVTSYQIEDITNHKCIITTSHMGNRKPQYKFNIVGYNKIWTVNK